jgi:membrane-associated phospholipid phosphatase
MRLRADDAITLGYLGCLAMLVLVFRERVAHAWFYLAIHPLWAGAVIGLIWKAERTPHAPWIFARNWYHLLSIPLAFRELHHLVHPINPRDLDPLLAQWDLALFGVHPTVWIERLMHPWLTEFLQLVYSSFYFLPVILGMILWIRRDLRAFHIMLTAIVTAFYVSYLGYFAFPALGPRYELAHLQQQPLEGVWLSSFLRASLDQLELLQRDAFPSGHVGVSLLVLHYSRRFAPATMVPYLVVVLGLVVSTVYLRYHYVVDVLAGFVLAVVSAWLAATIRHWMEPRKDEFGSAS